MTAKVAGAREGRPSYTVLSESLGNCRASNRALREHARIRQRELLEDIAFLQPRAARLASIAHHLGPEFHQVAWAIEARLGSMSRRAGFVL